LAVSGKRVETPPQNVAPLLFHTILAGLKKKWKKTTQSFFVLPGYSLINVQYSLVKNNSVFNVLPFIYGHLFTIRALESIIFAERISPADTSLS
jgi:hypothetical protein